MPVLGEYYRLSQPYIVGALTVAAVLLIPILGSAFYQIHVLQSWRNENLLPRLQELDTRIAYVQTVKGEKGDVGNTGSNGSKGDPGDIGDKGDKGDQGQGSPGPPGPVGQPGDPGTRGPTGARGEVGPQGAVGRPGRPGAAGQPGVAGPRGETGPPGVPGMDGRHGEAAKGGDTLAVPGPPGPVGPPGDQGLPGANGAPGEPGPAGNDGKPGLKGEQGPPGNKGEAGSPGMGVGNMTYEWSHPDGNRGDQYRFIVECTTNCRGLYIQMEQGSGDVDLYGKEGGMPHIEGNNCPARTCTCRSRTRNTDYCSIDRAGSNNFYVVLLVDKAHTDLKLVIEALNLKSVTPKQ